MGVLPCALLMFIHFQAGTQGVLIVCQVLYWRNTPLFLLLSNSAAKHSNKRGFIGTQYDSTNFNLARVLKFIKSIAFLDLNSCS